MYDKYIIVDKGLKNVTENGRTGSFQFEARLPYYRGLTLSMLENIAIKVDGTPVNRDEITLTLHGNTYTLDELETEYTDRWEFGEKGLIMVARSGGVEPGEHEIELTHFIRISYRPSILTGKDKKLLTLEN